jgi:hypothetical protein
MDLIDVDNKTKKEDEAVEWLSPGFRICLVNVLITVAKALGNGPIGLKGINNEPGRQFNSAEPNNDGSNELLLLFVFGRIVVPSVVGSFFQLCSLQLPIYYFVQLLFTVAYGLGTKVEAFGQDLLAVGLQAIYDDASEVLRSINFLFLTCQVRVAGLKLMGTLLASVPDLFANEESVFYRLHAGLQAIVQSADTSDEGRQLATQLLKATSPSSLA